MLTNIETRSEYKGLLGFITQLFSPKEVEKCDAITVPLVESSLKEQADGVNIERCINSLQNNKKLESYYNQIADILEKNGITIEEAKKAKLLEKLVLAEGISTENFEQVKEALEIALGKISLKHFGKSVLHAIKNLFSSDFNVDTIIEETQRELWNLKTDASLFGRKHYDTEEKLEQKLNKLGCLADGKSIEEGLNTLVKKCKNGEIKEIEVARILIDISSSKDINKAVAVQLIKCLANDDRALAIALMQNIKNLSPEELSKVDLEFVKEIKDIALGTDNSLEITEAVTVKSFKEMLKADITDAIEYMENDTHKFLEENSDKVRLAKEKAMRGETLTSEEETYLIYEMMYSSSVVGTSQNTNISYQEAQNFIQDILNDAHATSEQYNLEFEQDVLTGIVEITQEHPEYFTNRSIIEFTKILDNATGNKYSKIVAEYKNNKHYDTSTSTNTKTSTTDSDIKKYAAVNKLSKSLKQETTTDTKKDYTNSNIATATSPIKRNKPKDLTEKKKETEYNFDTEDINECAKHGKEGVEAFFAENSDKKAIKEVLTNLEFNNPAFVHRAKRIYKSKDANAQEAILKTTGFKGIVLLADSKNKTLKDMYNLYTNNALVEATEKVIENRTKYNPECQRYFEDKGNKESCA